MIKQDVKVTAQQVGSWTIYYLAGDIAENVELILEKVSEREEEKVIFDFSGVRSINSSGIADWIEFISDYAKTRKVVYDNCTPQIVDVMNMITSFHDLVQVRSILFPFQCQSCNHNWFTQKDLTKKISSAELHPPCPKCKELGTLDVDLEEHLYFLREDDG